MDTLLNLEGHAAIVTGASSGLGRHFALTLARAGAKVALAARRVDKLEELADEIAEFDGRAVAIPLDVTDPASIARCVEAAETELGAISILVNNSGTVARKPIWEHTPEDWDKVVDTNLKGAWLMALEVAKHMKRLGHGGSIVNITSILGDKRVSAQVPEYCASKGGLNHLTKAMATELAGDDIRVNAIAPGYFVTDINRDFLQSEAGDKLRKRVPMHRFGTYEDLDGALLMLASPRASGFVTGHTIVVDGGHSVASV